MDRRIRLRHLQALTEIVRQGSRNGLQFILQNLRVRPFVQHEVVFQHFRISVRPML